MLDPGRKLSIHNFISLNEFILDYIVSNDLIIRCWLYKATRDSGHPKEWLTGCEHLPWKPPVLIRNIMELLVLFLHRDLVLRRRMSCIMTPVCYATALLCYFDWNSEEFEVQGLAGSIQLKRQEDLRAVFDVGWSVWRPNLRNLFGLRKLSAEHISTCMYTFFSTVMGEQKFINRADT